MGTTLFRLTVIVIIAFLINNNLFSQLSCNGGSGIYINQILPDPNSTSGANFDTDCDGDAETQDEFVEICNGAAVDVDVSNFIIYDDAGNTFVFPNPTILVSGECLLVINTWASPVNQPGNVYTGLPSLSNSGDQILLFDPMTNSYISVVYNNQALIVDPAIAGATAICDEDFGSDTDGESLTISGSGLPQVPYDCSQVICAIVVADSIYCDSFSIGDDTYTAVLSFISADNATYTVSVNTGTVTPSIINSTGSLIVTGLVEGSGVTVIVSNQAGCEESVTIQSPECPAICPLEAKINEFHYDNEGSDVNEFVEITIPVGGDPTQIQIDLYNGNNGSSYNSNVLSAADLSSSDGVYDYYIWNVALQNGPDGIAISCLDGSPIEFISYEGQLVATDGPLIGESSFDILIFEDNSTPQDQSLQCDPAGGWCDGAFATPGITNNCTPICPDLTMQADTVIITNSICQSGESEPSGGSIIGITCPDGSIAEYSLDGSNWSTIVPLYNQAGPSQTISSRCNCDGNVTPINILTTDPGICVFCEAAITLFPANRN